MSFPRHIHEVPKDKRAIAPYNFVELPDTVVEAQDLPNGDRYHPNRLTGKIECTLTTESPLYIRCGLTTEEFKTNKEAKDCPDFFYTDPSSKSTKPVIPGSSLRGMLRNLVEIVSFSKIAQVSDEERLFFRAVAANPKNDSLGKDYKEYVKPENIQAGYLKKDSQGWYIQPAKTINNATFAWVKENKLNLSELDKFNDPNYKPQYISVSYEKVDIDNNDRAKPKRLFAWSVDSPDIYPKKQGVLVTSGNMKQGDESSPRRNHCLVFECLVFEENADSVKLRLDDQAIEHYRKGLTDFQKQSPFNKDWGMLEENRPVFYYPPQTGNIVGFFGQSPNFRIPYSPKGNGHASTVVDFIPKDLKDPLVIDIADAIFGWVRQDNKDEKIPKDKKQRAGRVFISDAKYESKENGLWYENDSDHIVTPQILASPKPTTFQHYLVQRKETEAKKEYLKHYASKPIEETVIRGHKLYWHKGSNPNIKSNRNDSQIESQTTQIKPINKGVTFKFTIHFENLSDVELGALLWVLDHAKGNYRLKLGMGKPLGMGAVKIESTLYLSDRNKRYTQLFDGNQWVIEENCNNSTKIANYIGVFECYIINEIDENEHPKDCKATQLYELPRIQILLAMLNWASHPSCDETKYMELGVFKYRKVLPTPLDVMNLPDNRRFPPVNPLSGNVKKESLEPPKKSSTLPQPKPKPKPNPKNNFDKPQKNKGNNFNPATQRSPKKPKKKF